MKTIRTVGIVGLGLIGGSMARSVRKHTIAKVYGYDQSPDHWNRDSHTHDNPELEETTEVENSTKTKKNKTLHTLRSRLTIEYDKKGWDWTPYIYVEAFNDLTNRMRLDKIRASIGVEYALTKQHKLGIGYVFNHEDDDDGNENIHAINVGYKFKF